MADGCSRARRFRLNWRFLSPAFPRNTCLVTADGVAVDPAQVALAVELGRLGGSVDHIGFAPQGDFLRGDRTVEEPHSFDVTVTATYAGQTQTWAYASHEGRTTIDPAMAQEAGVATATAGPGVITEWTRVYGVIVPDASRIRTVKARFPGVVRSLARQVGDPIRAGEVLATVESNDSLQTYAVTAPITGVVTQRHVGAGEQTNDEALFEIADFSRVWAEFSVFPVGPPAAAGRPACDGNVRGRVRGARPSAVSRRWPIAPRRA